ncbi:MAG TPA: PAS domain-containing protein, partial [Thermoanaerobaculia bacterium]|nr:PAS domain-containing protein [Thermoanaerobaculia bacterium]
MRETNDERRRARLLTVGLGPRISGALARVVAAAEGEEPAVIDASGWGQPELEALRCGPADVIVASGTNDHDLWARACTLRARHPGVPALARAKHLQGEEVAEILRAGFEEAFSGATDFGEALRRARARHAAPPRVQAEIVPGPEPSETGSPLANVVPNVFDWIWVVGIAEDGLMTFETVNPPLNADRGFLDPSFAGRPARHCLDAPDGARLLGYLERVQASGQPLQFEEPYQIEGKERSFQTLLTPVRNKWGRIHRIAGVSRDVTALREALSALRASEERLNHALEGTQQGLWDWEITTGRFYRGPRWFAMVGLPPGGIEESFEAGLKLVHPDDRRQIEAAMSAHLEGRVPRFEAEYRLRTRTGEWIWVFDAGKVVAREGSRPTRVAGLCTEITERRRAEEALRALVVGVVHEIRNPVYGILIN